MTFCEPREVFPFYNILSSLTETNESILGEVPADLGAPLLD